MKRVGREVKLGDRMTTIIAAKLQKLVERLLEKLDEIRGKWMETV